MKVILTIAGLAPEYGGPSYTVPALALALTRAGVEVELITCAPPPPAGGGVIQQGGVVATTWLARSHRTSRWRAAGNEFLPAIRKGLSSAECVIHDNGLWLAANHAVAQAARHLSAPLVVSPRGMLAPWARRHRGLKKSLAWHLYQKRDLGCARALHATSSIEAEDLRAVGLTVPIAVVPNGVELPPWQELPRRNSHQRTLLFLSRVHPQKGLMNLVKAWALVRPRGWKVVIAGGDEGGHRSALDAALRREGMEQDFEFLGHVPPARRWDVYRSGDLFILPSHSENFGLAVAEAMASGLPVITTRRTPWDALASKRCGWWVDGTPAALAGAIAEGTALLDDERVRMGHRARALVESEYGWDRVAEKMLDVYRSLTHWRAAPAAVGVYV